MVCSGVAMLRATSLLETMATSTERMANPISQCCTRATVLLLQFDGLQAVLAVLEIFGNGGL